MDPNGEARAQVVRELSQMLRRQARHKWNGVQTARRRESEQLVWRFRRGSGAPERFLLVTYEAMDQAQHSSELLLEQLRSGRWLDRLDGGAETAVRLSTGGRVESYPSA